MGILRASSLSPSFSCKTWKIVPVGYGEQKSDPMRDPEMPFERELSPRNSVLRRNFFGVVHHDHLDGDPPRFQLEPQFLLQDLENCARGHVDDALRRSSGAIAAAGDR